MIHSMQFTGWGKIDKSFFPYIKKGDTLCDMKTYFVINKISEKTIEYIKSDFKNFKSIREKILSGKINPEDCMSENLKDFDNKCKELYVHPHKKMNKVYLCEKCCKIIYIEGEGFIDDGFGICEVCERELCSDCGGWDHSTGDCKDCVDKRRKKNNAEK